MKVNKLFLFLTLTVLLYAAGVMALVVPAALTLQALERMSQGYTLSALHFED